MPYNTKYRGQFSTINGDTCQIDFKFDGYLGATTFITLAGDPLTIEKPAKKFDEPIFSGGATVRVLPESFLQMKDLFGGGELSVKVVISLNSDIIFQGFVVPVLYEDPYNGLNTPVQIPISDGLSHLKHTNTYLPPTNQSLVSILEIVQENLKLTGLNLPLRIHDNLRDQSHGSYEPLSQTYVHRNILQAPGDDPITAYDMLKDLLLVKNCRLYQHNNSWFLERITDLYDGTFLHDYDSYPAGLYDDSNRVRQSISKSLFDLRTDVKVVGDSSLSFERGKKTINIEQEIDRLENWINWSALYDNAGNYPAAGAKVDGWYPIPDPSDITGIELSDQVEFQKETAGTHEGRIRFTGGDLAPHIVGAFDRPQIGYGWPTMGTKIRVTGSDTKRKLNVKMSVANADISGNSKITLAAGLAVHVVNDDLDFWIKAVNSSLKHSTDFGGQMQMMIKYNHLTVGEGGDAEFAWEIDLSGLGPIFRESNDVWVYLTPTYSTADHIEIKEFEDNKFTYPRFDPSTSYIKELQINVEPEEDIDNVLQGIIDQDNIEAHKRSIRLHNTNRHEYYNNLYDADWNLLQSWDDADGLGPMTIQERLLHDLFQFYQKPRYSLKVKVKHDEPIEPHAIFNDPAIDNSRKFMIRGMVWDVKWNKYSLDLIEHVGYDGAIIN